MSDAVDDWNTSFKDLADAENKKREVQAKKLLVDENRYNVELARIERTADELARAENTNFGLMTAEQVAEVRKENIDYIMAARKALKFINRAFGGIMPYFRKNLILIGGDSGHGKSTCVANLVKETMAQISHLTGRPANVLVITNEEKREDVFNRVTCLVKGWHYVNHDQFTDEQLKIFDQFIPMLSQYMNVVDDNYNGVSGMTTSLEGICQIFDNMLRDGTMYDAIIIDYYQNITYSKESPSMGQYEVQALVCHKLDQYKNVYPAPIVIMAQCDPPDEAKTPFKFRLKGAKMLFTKATLAIEMTRDADLLKTIWEVHKSRFTNAIGKKFDTAYNKGKIDIYDDEFIKKIVSLKEERMNDAALLKNIGKDGKDEKPVDEDKKEG